MEVEIGKVVHYYGHIRVAVLALTDSLKLGDKIHISGHDTELTQRISSMEIDHRNVVWVKPGQTVAIKLIRPVHEHDIVYRMVEETPEPQPA